MIFALIQRVDLLDQNLGEIVQRIIGEGIAQTHEINPIQMMFMDIIKSQLQQKDNSLDLLRNDNGRFTKDTSLSTEL